eukprot:4126426-Alexandrium_andersonii.AAC.1
MARLQGIPDSMELSGDLATDWRAVGDALPPILAGIMVTRSRAVFADPLEAHLQVLWNQRVWIELCTAPTRPRIAPEDLWFGVPPAAHQRPERPEHDRQQQGDQARVGGGDGSREARLGDAGGGVARVGRILMALV